MSAQSELGPNGVPAWKLYQMAGELAALAQLARDCAAMGPSRDLPRAVATLDRMRALLGGGVGED